MRRLIQIASIVAVSAGLAACLPPNSLLKSRDLRKVEVGYTSDGSGADILPNDDAVDELASDITEILQTSGLKMVHASVSYGIQPWTGHTQNLYFQPGGGDRVRCVVEISKSAFSAQFEEIETAPNTNEFKTSDLELAGIVEAAAQLKEFVAEIFPKRSIRVSIFESPTGKSGNED